MKNSEENKRNSGEKLTSWKEVQNSGEYFKNSEENKILEIIGNNSVI